MRKAPRRGLGRALPVAADFNSLHMPPASFSSISMNLDLAASVEPFKFSPAEPVAYEGIQMTFAHLAFVGSPGLHPGPAVFTGIVICHHDRLYSFFGKLFAYINATSMAWLCIHP